MHTYIHTYVNFLNFLTTGTPVSLAACAVLSVFIKGTWTPGWGFGPWIKSCSLGLYFR